MHEHLRNVTFDFEKVELYCDPADHALDSQDRTVRTFNDFVELPERLGWTIHENGERRINFGSATLENVTQRWLYFEVLAQTFGHLPDYKWSDFVEGNPTGLEYITSRRLPAYLEKWLDSEKRSQPIQSRSRLIRIHQVLDKSRAYVSQHCAVPTRDDTATWEVNDLLALSFMVLGETLTRALSLIQRRLRFRIEGWCGYDLPSQGWGYGRDILQRLVVDEEYCAKAVYMLQAQLRGNSVGLIFLFALRLTSPRGSDHRGCTPNECKELDIRHTEGKPKRIDYHYCVDTSEFGSKPYDKAGNPIRPLKCETYSNSYYTIKGKRLAEVIDRGNIPLFQYHRSKQEVQLHEMRQSFNKPYAIFSHVWTDGFGSDGESGMKHCVLHMLSKMLETVHTLRFGDKSKIPELFWIDTLSIPQEKGFETQRRNAIRQMHSLYTRAQYTIVLDLSLMHATAGIGYSSPAMKITMSRWMTRMWTLQEAVLSKDIYFVFKDRIYPMSQLEGMFTDEDSELQSCIPALARTYHAGILGNIRSKIHAEFRREEGWNPGPDDLASIWKAAQWRTTTHPIHETLALATMLGLDTYFFASSPETKENTDEHRLECDKRMVVLLSRLAAMPRCPIPPGMIFLPGPKLSQKGYGWAPRTWLSSHAIDSPDPLSLPSLGNTRLTVPKGLEVQFPGFLLHDLEEDREKIYTSREEFYFSTESTLLDWYRVEPTRHTDNFPVAQQCSKLKHLAIILCRLPVEEPREIALFVEVQEEYGGIRYVEVLNRVWISREKRSKEWQDWSEKHRKGDPEAMCAGERLPPTTVWCVDGPSPPEPEPEPEPEQEPVPEVNSRVKANGQMLENEREEHEKERKPVARSQTMGDLLRGRGGWKKGWLGSHNPNNRNL
ncbi:MAG: hypothetical protein L6R41_004406 [Letrouitia leprolyta]|nr:MAG: hypothetical protein L6R41_004406 [Letrouitia leprolyta]